MFNQEPGIEYEAPVLRIFNDKQLRSRVLSAYFDTTRYLKSADIFVNRHDGVDIVSSRGIFSIPESCYIQSTGHFNSVEFNICYNQIMYDTIAHASKYGLMARCSDWGVEGFFQRQLPDVLITRFHSRFSRPVDPAQFQGEFSIHSARLHRVGKPFLLLKTHCRFFDSMKGEAVGDVDLAILNP
jgi:hypothetical protein